jgi:hypothetical protein
VLNRANAIEELIWNHKGICFELAVELSIPERFPFVEQKMAYTALVLKFLILLARTLLLRSR